MQATENLCAQTKHKGMLLGEEVKFHERKKQETVSLPTSIKEAFPLPRIAI